MDDYTTFPDREQPFQNVPFSSDFRGAESSLSLDKLAQLPTRASDAGLRSPFLGVVDPVKTLVNRTRSKSLDFVIKGRLMNDQAIRETSPLHRSYVKSTACNSVLTQEDGKIKGFYCKQRWCAVCNRIRTGVLFNKYEEVIRGFEDRYLVSLTLENCKAEDLPETIDEMIRLFGLCAMSIKQTEKLEFKALRKMEVTYNSRFNSYHPHFHVICKGKETAEKLIKQWLIKVNKYSKNKEKCRAVEDAQDMTPCDENTMKELFKYFTKLINEQRLYPKVLDVIFQAMKGRRTFQAYLPKYLQKKVKNIGDEEDLVLERGTPAITRLNENILWDYIPEARNYVDKDTGELLTDYKPTETFERLLKKLGDSG
ncbi:MAG: protein rep [Candidatus Ozemobacteraceae bacterium]